MQVSAGSVVCAAILTKILAAPIAMAKDLKLISQLLLKKSIDN